MAANTAANGAASSPQATVRSVHTPRPIGSMGVRPGGKPSTAKKPATKPAKKGRK